MSQHVGVLDKPAIPCSCMFVWVLIIFFSFEGTIHLKPKREKSHLKSSVSSLIRGVSMEKVMTLLWWWRENKNLCKIVMPEFSEIHLWSIFFVCVCVENKNQKRQCVCPLLAQRLLSTSSPAKQVLYSTVRQDESVLCKGAVFII